MGEKPLATLFAKQLMYASTMKKRLLDGCMFENEQGQNRTVLDFEIGTILWISDLTGNRLILEVKAEYHENLRIN